MAEPLRPAETKTFGRENWIYVQTIGSGTLAPTVAEVTATSSLDFTRIAFADGTDRPTQNTNLVEKQRRYGDTSTSQFIGQTTHQGGQLVYQFAPQAAAMSDGKKMWEKIPAGTTGFLVERLGVARATAPAAGQFVNVWPIEFGPSLPTKAGDGESAEAAATCTYAVGEPALNVAVLA